MFSVDPVIVLQDALPEVLHQRTLAQWRPSIVVPASSASYHWNSVVFSQQNQVQRAFLCKHTAIGEDIESFQEEFGNTSLKKVSHISVLAYKFCLTAIIESLDVDLLTVRRPLLLADVQDDVMFGNVLLQVFAD
jgi:hypothetical protein